MYPRRRDYVRTLMREVGSAHVGTYSDFQDTHPEGEPDFFIHVAEKAHRRPDKAADSYSSTVHTARDSYNSEDADAFYSLVWCGEDIHGTSSGPRTPCCTAVTGCCRRRVRVLRPGGRIVFTDPMAADGCPREALAPSCGACTWTRWPHRSSTGAPLPTSG